MSVIWKSKIYLDGCDLPADAKILHVAEHHNYPCVWFETSGELPAVRCTRIVGLVTGAEVPNGDHLGTVLLDGGSFILHYYDTRPKR